MQSTLFQSLMQTNFKSENIYKPPILAMTSLTGIIYQSDRE